MKAAILTDVTKCIGCERVRDGLQEDQSSGRPMCRAAGMPDDGLSARNWTSIVRARRRRMSASNAAIAWSRRAFPRVRWARCTRPRSARSFMTPPSAWAAATA